MHHLDCWLAPTQSTLLGSVRHVRFRCCRFCWSHLDQADQASQPRRYSQLGISQDSRTTVGPSQAPGPRHWRLLLRTPNPQDTEHSDQSVQHDHWPSTSETGKIAAGHGFWLQERVSVYEPSHEPDSHCLICVNLVHIIDVCVLRESILVLQVCLFKIKRNFPLSFRTFVVFSLPWQSS